MSAVWVATLVTTVVAVAITMLALATGLVLGRRAPRGSCGGACLCKPEDARACQAQRRMQ